MTIHIISFGFKYGQPADAQLQFDVRCLPNPYYIPDLRPLSGLDAEVYDYVMSFDESKHYLEAMEQVVSMTARLRLAQQKDEDLTVYIGCTGGRHRSVTLARALTRSLEEAGYVCCLRHRQMDDRTGE